MGLEAQGTVAGMGRKLGDNSEDRGQGKPVDSVGRKLGFGNLWRLGLISWGHCRGLLGTLDGS